MYAILVISMMSSNLVASEYGVYPGTSTVHAGGLTTLWLVLPPADVSQARWSLYFADSEVPVLSADLQNAPQVLLWPLRVEGDGTKMVLLTIVSKSGELAKTYTAEVRIMPRRILDWLVSFLKSVCSAVIAAILAIFGFRLQESIKEKIKRKEEHSQASALDRSWIDSLLEWDGTPASVPAMPDNIASPTSAVWSSVEGS